MCGDGNANRLCVRLVCTNVVFSFASFFTGGFDPVCPQPNRTYSHLSPCLLDNFGRKSIQFTGAAGAQATIVPLFFLLISVLLSERDRGSLAVFWSISPQSLRRSISILCFSRYLIVPHLKLLCILTLRLLSRKLSR